MSYQIVSKYIKSSNKNLIWFFLVLFSAVIFFFLSKNNVLASSVDGTIDSVNKYAWGENIGWINFGATIGNVHVTDSGLSGYALGENIGWINLDNVINDGEGNLSGYAWGENIGWISFNPTNGGVVINPTGQFSGSALGENIGWIIFEGDDVVVTDWRPRSGRPDCNDSYDNDSDGYIDYPADFGCSSLSDGDEVNFVSSSNSGGGTLPPEAYVQPTTPSGGFQVNIGGGITETNSRLVVLSLKGGADTKLIWLSENESFSVSLQFLYNSSLENNSVSFNLSGEDGLKTIYVKFCTSWGQCSGVISDSIFLKSGSISEKITSASENILKQTQIFPEIINNLPSPIIGGWQTPSLKSESFIISTILPESTANLFQKFPEFKKIFEKIGITKSVDLSRLKNTKLVFPSPIKGVPISEMSLAAKQQLPTEFVFVKTDKGLVDLKMELAIDEGGESEQNIKIISGKDLQLIVKPDKSVKSVKGYLVFKPKKFQSGEIEILKNNIISNLFIKAVFADEQNQSTADEDGLVVMEFEYEDLDGDGIYTANINTPTTEGEYEIVTVVDYQGIFPEKKEVRLTALIDPEGYVFEKNNNKETRIPGAIVSIFSFNRKTNQYELWEAKEYQQENPQTTDITGEYSFLVPEGLYYLRAEAENYLVYNSKPFQIESGSGVNHKIELKIKFGWIGNFDWEIVLLIILAVLLFYNFYKDRKRNLR